MGLTRGWKRAQDLLDRADEVGYEASQALRSVQFAAASVAVAATLVGTWALGRIFEEIERRG